MEDVRAPTLDERGPLRDAETVLLVDDSDCEVGEVDLLLLGWFCGPPSRSASCATPFPNGVADGTGLPSIRADCTAS
jgi:hypothetical protein